MNSTKAHTVTCWYLNPWYNSIMSLLPIAPSDVEEINTTTEQAAIYLTDNLPLIVVVTIITFFIFKLINAITKRLDNVLKRHMKSDTYVSTVQRIINIILKTFVILIVLNILGVSLSFMLTILLFVVVIIAIGMRDFISNISAGMVLLTGKIFNNGDYIEVNGVEGTVQKTELLHTKLLTPDNKVITIPNTQVVLGNITNYDKRRTMRVEIDVYVKYKNDLHKTFDILTKTATNLEYSLKEPEPFVVVKGLEPYGVHAQIRFYVKSKDYWNAEWNAPVEIKEALSKEGIEFVELNCSTNVDINSK